MEKCKLELNLNKNIDEDVILKSNQAVYLKKFKLLVQPIKFFNSIRVGTSNIFIYENLFIIDGSDWDLNCLIFIKHWNYNKTNIEGVFFNDISGLGVEICALFTKSVSRIKIIFKSVYFRECGDLLYYITDAKHHNEYYLNIELKRFKKRE